MKMLLCENIFTHVKKARSRVKILLCGSQMAYCVLIFLQDYIFEQGLCIIPSAVPGTVMKVTLAGRSRFPSLTIVSTADGSSPSVTVYSVGSKPTTKKKKK